jgi:hypothetical protein
MSHRTNAVVGDCSDGKNNRRSGSAGLWGNQDTVEGVSGTMLVQSKKTTWLTQTTDAEEEEDDDSKTGIGQLRSGMLSGYRKEDQGSPSYLLRADSLHGEMGPTAFDADADAFDIHGLLQHRRRLRMKMGGKVSQKYARWGVQNELVGWSSK